MSASSQNGRKPPGPATPANHVAKAIAGRAAPPRPASASAAPLQPRNLPTHLARAIAKPAAPGRSLPLQAKRAAAAHVAQAIARPAAPPPPASRTAAQPARPPAHLAAALVRPAGTQRNAPPAAKAQPPAPAVQRRAVQPAAPLPAAPLPAAPLPAAPRAGRAAAGGPVIQRYEWRYDGSNWLPNNEETRNVPAPQHLFGGEFGQVFRMPAPTRLILGEGNFSFSASYLTRHPTFAPTTTVSDLTDVGASGGGRNQATLTQLGSTPVFGVNATTDTRPREVDHFNFPHPGQLSGTSALIGNYFTNLSASQEEGHIVRMGLEEKKDDELPNVRYGLLKHMKRSKYRPYRKMSFDNRRFRGYSHTKTNANNGQVDFKGRRVEIWFRNEGRSGDRTGDLRNLAFTDGEDSDEERREVVDRRNRKLKASAERRHTRDRLDLTIRLKRERPKIRIEGSFTFTTITADAFRTVIGDFRLRPTGKLLRASLLEVEFERSSVSELRGAKVWVKSKHLQHLFANGTAHEI